MTASELRKQNKKLERAGCALLDVVKFYADPSTYHGVSFIGDPPCGGFVHDFDNSHGTQYGKKPGKRARAVMRKMRKMFHPD